MIAAWHGAYHDRRAAGRELARLLQQYAGDPDVRVLALPRGGLPVASEIAQHLGAQLDVLVVRKLGLPWLPEVAAGAIGPSGVIIRSPQVTAHVRNLDAALAQVAAGELIEMQRRDLIYRRGRAPLDVRDRIVILVDDGMATGSTMEAAVLAVRAMKPRSVVVAVPVAAPEAVAMLASNADRVVCAHQPQSFIAVGHWYEEFPQLTDAEVVQILARHGGESCPAAHRDPLRSRPDFTSLDS